MGVFSSTNDRHGFFGAAYYFTKTKLLNDIGHFGSSPICFCFEGKSWKSIKKDVGRVS